MELSERIEARRAAVGSSSRKEFAVTKADIANEEEHIILVKFASFGNKDSAGDILVKGCFAKSIRERGPQSTTNRKIAFLWQHNFADPIGRVLSIEERNDGAYAEVKLSNFDAVPNAKRTWFQLKDGDINQFSFGFNYVWDKLEYDEALDAYIVKEVVLREISVVTAGANEQTEFVGVVKSLPDAIKVMTDALNEAPADEKVRIKRQIIETLNAAEPEKPLTAGNMFEKIGTHIN